MADDGASGAQSRWRALLDRVPERVAVLAAIRDASGEVAGFSIRHLNATARREGGSSATVSFAALFGPDARACEAACREALETGAAVDRRAGAIELHAERGEGDEVVATWRRSAADDGRDGATATRSEASPSAEDAARERLEAQNAQLCAVYEAMEDGLVLFDASGTAVIVNDAQARLCGFASADAMKLDLAGYGELFEVRELDGSPVPVARWPVSRVLGGERISGLELAVRRLDTGAEWIVRFSGQPIHDHAGALLWAVVISSDVTMRRRAEAAGRESEARFRTLADNIPQLAWIADANGWIGWYNERWFDYTSTTLEEMQGWGWQKVHHPDHVDRVTEKFRRHVESGEPWEDTFPLRSGSGEYRWFLSRAFPIRDDGGRVVRWFGTNTDVTAQREADRRKDEFIAILAHELRNPLAPVRNAVELMRVIGVPDARIERAREVIDRQVSHMARLIDDLLDISRIARGKLNLQRERCDFGAIARQTAEDYRASIEAAGLTLTVTTPAEPVHVDGDPVRLAQMLGNLLQNAARFTPAGGRVEVSVRAAEGRALATVRDTGIGIDVSLLSRIFDPFSQADQGLARSNGGLGLGLALTRGLAELHGGEVVARSDGDGKGAAFTLGIPALEDELESSRYEGPSAGSRALRVLLVEDSRDAAEMLSALLELGGHSVEVAYDGRSALAAANERRPDVVISDIGLPDMDGYAIARALRASPGLEGLHLIAVSGYANEEARQRAREAGFAAHFAKPVALEALQQALGEVRGS